MPVPAIDDTIIAISTGWQAAPVGVIRLSGSGCFGGLRSLGVSVPSRPADGAPVWSAVRLDSPFGLTLPATALWFFQPRSYTGQDVVELHTVGCLPLLRILSAHLIDQGARRALPGEFTARAFLHGKLDTRQVEAVLDLIHASSAAEARAAVRQSRVSHGALLKELGGRITALLALIEAGIDFVEEEDVRFVTPAELARAIDEMLALISAVDSPDHRALRGGKPHVALAGAPNAGKSTLFNALLGYERAIVSPVLGTTRDVLCAEVAIRDVAVVLQDCAGLGAAANDLELAAHVAAEEAVERADLVLWVHDRMVPWSERERQVCTRIPPERRILVRSKADLAPAVEAGVDPTDSAAVVDASVVTCVGLERLRAAIAEQLLVHAETSATQPEAEAFRAVTIDLGRARAAIGAALSDLEAPEIVALELRSAAESCAAPSGAALVEEILARIFSQFCLGK